MQRQPGQHDVQVTSIHRCLEVLQVSWVNFVSHGHTRSEACDKEQMEAGKLSTRNLRHVAYRHDGRVSGDRQHHPHAPRSGPEARALCDARP